MSESSEVKRIKTAYADYARRSPANRGSRRIVGDRNAGIDKILYKHGVAPLNNSTVLDIGCGRGGVLARLTGLGAESQNLYGVDLRESPIEAARRAHPHIRFECANGERLGFCDHFFDLVLILMVFSSILDESMAHNVAAEAGRVLKPGGSILWHDMRYDNPRNPSVHGMRKRNIRELFPGFELHLDSSTLLPPLARRLGRTTPALYPLLSAIPWLRTHYLGLLVKPT